MSTAVVIALYNGAKYIRKQLDSIRLQSVLPDKVVMCDDGSTDNTVSIVNEYIIEYNLSDKWFIYQNEQNLGYIKNFYKAMSLCDEDLLFLCDQDDLWKQDKIEIMTNAMAEKKDCVLLSSKYGIIDANDNVLHDSLQEKVNEDCSTKKVCLNDIMRAYRWPGMVMCVKNDFFKSVYKYICDYRIPHDLAFTILASEINGFYEIDYIGAFHRRHDNNVAREEHRIFKLLNIDKKIKDIDVLIDSLQEILSAKLPISKDSKQIIEYKLNYLNNRRDYILNKKLFKIIALYKKDNFTMFRKVSLICDIYLILFCKTKEII